MSLAKTRRHQSSLGSSIFCHGEKGHWDPNLGAAALPQAASLIFISQKLSTAPVTGARCPLTWTRCSLTWTQQKRKNGKVVTTHPRRTGWDEKLTERNKWSISLQNTWESGEERWTSNSHPHPLLEPATAASLLPSSPQTQTIYHQVLVLQPSPLSSSATTLARPPSSLTRTCAKAS